MRLTRVKVENHSRLQDLELEVRQHMVLIGPNDVGKSSLLRCLDLLLGASTGQLYNQIAVDDLRNPGDPFVIEADLQGFSENEQALFVDEITVDPNSEKEQTLTIRLEASFDDLGTLFVTRTVPNKNTGRQLSREQLQAIGWTLLNANDRARSMSNDRRSLLDDVLANVELGDEQVDFEEIIKEIGEKLQNSVALSELRGAMADQLSTALPERVAQDDLTFVPGAAADNNVLKGVRLEVNKKSISEQSDGKRAIYAIALYDLISNGANIVAIDEPEIHLHPSSQRSLARLLKNGRNQKIIATHSPDIVSAFDPELIVSVREGGEAVQSERDFLTDDQRMTLRWWARDKLEPLTARHVVFVEGISDRIVIERVAELTGRNLDRLGISIVETGGAGDMGPIWNLFGPNGFNTPLSLLIDEDAIVKTANNIGITEEELRKFPIWISRRDLEDEYVRAVGVSAYWDALCSSDQFGRNELDELKEHLEAGALSKNTLAEYCRQKGHKGRKVRAAIVAAEVLDKTSASLITSVNALLDSVEA